MLVFCRWRDEDGTHYAISRSNPHKYFNWRGWRACNVQVCNITAANATKIAGIKNFINDDFIEIDINDWDTYFTIEKSLHSLK